MDLKENPNIMTNDSIQEILYSNITEHIALSKNTLTNLYLNALFKNPLRNMDMTKFPYIFQSIFHIIFLEFMHFISPYPLSLSKS